MAALTLVSWLTYAAPSALAKGDSSGESPASEPVRAEPVSDLARPITSERDLVFAEVAGVKLKGDLFRPADDKIYPLVVMIHGGAWSSGDKWHLHDHARELAQAGFVAFTINYRLAPIHRFPAQIDDCRLALRWAAEQAEAWKADPKRLAVWGYSAGAHLAGLLVTRPEEGEPAIKAAVLGGAPCEFTFIPESSHVLAAVMGGSRAQCPDVYRDASPLEFASSQVCPTFFFHGTSDLLVPTRSSQLLHDRLVELGTESQYHLVEGRGHMLTFLDREARRLAIQFLQQQISTDDE
jgi:acetyl esterase/lipase